MNYVHLNLTRFTLTSLYIFFSFRFVENKNDFANDSNFWIVNENLYIASLLPVLKDIALFALRSNEVIVIDFSDFPIGIQKCQLYYRFRLIYIPFLLLIFRFRLLSSSTPTFIIH